MIYRHEIGEGNRDAPASAHADASATSPTPTLSCPWESTGTRSRPHRRPTGRDREHLCPHTEGRRT